MAKKAPWGGFREGSGRKTLFPAKAPRSRKVTVTITLTRTAVAAAKEQARALTVKKPKIAAAADVNVVTLSDAIEYLVRLGTHTPLED